MSEKEKKELQIQVLGIGIHFSKVKGIWLCLIVKEKLHLSCVNLTEIFKSCLGRNFKLSKFQKQPH